MSQTIDTIFNKIQIIQRGITDIPADCVVNAANTGLWQGGGVCGAIFEAAGARQLTKACSAIGHCETGNAVITPAFNLNAKYIIHAVGPVYRDGKHKEPQQLYDAYKNSLLLAMKNDCHSIVFPVISSGIFGYPHDAAWRKAIQSCAKFLTKYPDYEMKIMFAVPSGHMIHLGYQAIDEVKASYKADAANISVQSASGKNESEKNTSDSTAGNTSASAEGTSSSSKEKAGYVSHADRIKVFQDTLKWIEENPRLKASVAASKKKTKIYWEDEYPAIPDNSFRNQTIEVTKSRTYEAAMRLSEEHPGDKIAVLNFANAFKPGGGVEKGSSAQEECLCRCSTLYPLLYRKSLINTFYKYHRDHITAKASDSLIYTEDVVICKTDESYPQRMPEKDWVTVDVITLAAPDLRHKSNKYAPLAEGSAKMNNAELFGYHVKRAMHMLTVAAHKNVDILVLGAFGCGAFENNPTVVAHAYRTALAVFPKVFKKVEFAIYCSEKETKNYTEFKKVLC